MKDLQEIKNFTQLKVKTELKRTLESIEKNGFDDDTYIKLRMLETALCEANAINRFNNMWGELDETK